MMFELLTSPTLLTKKALFSPNFINPHNARNSTYTSFCNVTLLRCSHSDSSDSCSGPVWQVLRVNMWPLLLS